jgi:hypothetical protein
MLRSRFVLCLLTTVVAGCYSDRLPPPNFRHACGGDGDCGSAERCISGLCQVPCTQATAEDDCPSTDGFVACFNGACVGSCQLPPEVCEGEGADEVCERPERQGSCSKPQLCIDLGIDLGGGGGGFFGGGGDVDVGVCGEWCTENSCPEGEICIQQFCVATCDPTGPDTCNSSLGLSCQEGLCLPDLGESLPTTETDSGMPTTGASTDSPTTTDAPTGTDSAASEGGS